MTELENYDFPFDERAFVNWIASIGKPELGLLETALEASEAIDDNGHFELRAMYTTTGRPEIFWGN